ncbi:MAG: dephospho-CoA kinase [Flavobacterium sp.]|nr:dephospho-CoA kinase [Flavobacterium sp.]
MTIIIGLTGGIGSGKTTIATYFKAKGVPVYIADNQARKIMESPEIISDIKQVFGISIFENETLNRQKLADIVFDNPEKLKLLNAIIHPAVKEDFNQWILNHKSAAFIVYESAILFESGSYKNCDLIINVTAPIETRIQRVIERDKTTREAVLKRMERQWTDEQRSKKSDFNIDNSTLESTKLEFEKILKILNN